MKIRTATIAGVVLIVGAAILFGAGLASTRARPRIRQASISLPSLAAATPAFRIALLGDIHIGNVAMDRRRLTSIVQEVNDVRPDLVLIAGDFVSDHNSHRAALHAAGLVEPLSRLRAPLGVVAVLGNHDYWSGQAAITSALNGAGVTVLDNEAVRRGPLVIAGIGDKFSGHDRAASALEAARSLGGPIVALTHSPDLAPDLPPDVPLALAGHTHCGQVILPLVGAPVKHSPLTGKALYNPRYRCGLIRDLGRTVIVTGGLGIGALPFRIGAPPDFWVITLQR